MTEIAMTSCWTLWVSRSRRSEDYCPPHATARNASSPASRTSCVSIRHMATPHCTARIAISSSACCGAAGSAAPVAEAQTLLAEMDAPGLLSGMTAAQIDVDALDEDALLAELGVTSEPASPADSGDITVLRHVRSHIGIKAAEKIPARPPSVDFNH